MTNRHRLSCFRDDVIFLVYVYQRWAYKVDKNRPSRWSNDEETSLEDVEKIDALTEGTTVADGTHDDASAGAGSKKGKKAKKERVKMMPSEDVLASAPVVPTTTPGGSEQTAAAASAPPKEEGFDDLMARFEALKRA